MEHQYMQPTERIAPYLKEDWMFAVLLIILIVLAVVKYSYPRRMLRLAQALVRVRILFQLMRENMVLSHRTAVTLFLTFTVSTGLLLFVAAKAYQWEIYSFLGFWLFPVLVGLVAIIYLWKIVTIRLIQTLFGGNGGLSEYLNYSFVMNALLGVLWLPIVLVTIVTLTPFARGAIWFALGVLALSWIIRIIQGIQFALKQGVFLVYIILYLCALEILPLAIIAKGVAEMKF